MTTICGSKREREIRRSATSLVASAPIHPTLTTTPHWLAEKQPHDRSSHTTGAADGKALQARHASVRGETLKARDDMGEAAKLLRRVERLPATGSSPAPARSLRTEYQQELTQRLQLSYRLLSDPNLELAGGLGLPTFTAQAPPRGSAGPQRLYRRLTLVLRAATIEHVFYPVFPPDRHAEEVLDWVRTHPVAH